MRSFMLRFAILSFLILAANLFFFEHLQTLYSRFGQPEEIQSMVTTYSLIGGAGAILFIFVKTIIGILSILLFLFIVYILLNYFIF